MSDTNIKKRINKLRNEILKHSHDYYVLDKSNVEDSIYDSLVRELKELDKKYPDFSDPNFIIYRVGGKPLHHLVITF